MQSEPSVKRVILITIDTLRADHLSAYGYPWKTSPFLDSLAHQGLLFKNTFAAMATTTPSLASLFTSLYPLQHRVLNNRLKLNDAFCTMAESFQDMGYDTAGIVSTRHFEAGNMHQGFQYFSEPDTASLMKGEGYRNAQDTVDAAIAWLNTGRSNDKFFLWIHLYDPHTPLKPPEEHYKSCTVSSDATPFLPFLVEQHHIEIGFFDDDAKRMLPRSAREHIAKDSLDNNADLLLTLIRKYDAEIHYADTQIQRFYKYYQTKERTTDNLWVITADHGEGLGTHNWWLHGKNIYNEQLRVPLLFYFSSGFGKGRVIEEVVENVDIFPTMIELAGGSPPSSGEIQGESLLPFLLPKEGRSYHKANAFSQRKAFEGVPPTRIDPKKTNYEGGEKYALQSARYKYIYRTSGEEELFDLQADPYETVNLANTSSEEKQRLRKDLLRKIEQLKPETPVEKQTVDKEAMEQLKSLGYVQ